MAKKHALLSASGAKKWLNCPLSVQMESRFPETENTYAAEGTAAHALAEAKIRLALGLLTQAEYKIKKENNAADADMDSYTTAYSDFVLERFNAAKQRTTDAAIKIEEKVDFSEYVPEGFGTTDALIMDDTFLEVIDLKYGKGVLVSAENNPQLMLYALGALAEYDYLYDIQIVITTIYQPRLDNISSYTLTVKELKEWGENVVRPKAENAFNSNGECCAGDHCDTGFCKARNICKKYAELRMQLAQYDFKGANELSVYDIADILSKVDKLVSWAKSIKEYALDQAVNNGIRYPGFKLVEGKSNRAFASEEKVVKALEDIGYSEVDIFNKKLKSLTELEKLLGKKRFKEILAELVIKPAGKPTLVPEKDKREEINSATDDFEDYLPF